MRLEGDPVRTSGHEPRARQPGGKGIPAKPLLHERLVQRRSGRWSGTAGGDALLRLPESGADIAVAGRHVHSGEDPGVDHICCGSFSHVEILLVAGERDAAAARASRIVAEAENKGGYRLFRQLPRTARNVTLGQGPAGIGYQLLRLADPERIPSILLWN
jgi:hypothetical protein